MASSAPPFLFVISSTAAVIGWTIPGGILFPFRPGYVRYTTWFHSNPALHHSMEFVSILFHFLTQYRCNMLCRLFDNRKYMDIYIYISPYTSGKQKISLYFSASTCEHLWPSSSNLVNCAKCSHNPSKDAADWSVVADFKSILNFKKIFFENLAQSS